MNTRPPFEQQFSDWLEDGPADAPDHVLETVLAAFPSIPQRRGVLRVPWRNSSMNGYARIVAGVAAVVAIAVGALFVVPRLQPGNVGGQPSAPLPMQSPSPTPSATLAPTPSSTPIDPSTWTSFRSARHGYSISYPADWTVTPATAPWLAGTDPGSPPNATLDVFTGAGTNGPTFVVVSQPLAKGVTGTAWLTAYESLGATRMPAVCWPPPDQMEPTTIGGQPASIHGGSGACGFTEAVAIVGGRVYELTGYPTRSASGVFDRALFDAFLSTVQFDPTSADDRPAVSPKPS
jgi:hypothetical protein